MRQCGLVDRVIEDDRAVGGDDAGTTTAGEPLDRVVRQLIRRLPLKYIAPEFAVAGGAFAILHGTSGRRRKSLTQRIIATGGVRRGRDTKLVLARNLTGCGKSGILGPDMAYNPRRVTRCGGRPMRGWDARSEGLFSYVSCEARVPLDHPLRPIGKIVDEALGALSGEFEKLYAKFGRPSIAPEKLLRALLLQAFYSVRSERQLMEQLGYNLLFRWFVGLSLDAAVWDVTVFTKNRERLIAGDIASKFMAAVLNQERVKALLSDDHFSVDGTLIEAWASMKSFRPKDGSGAPPAPGHNGERDFHGEKRSNQTHASTTDPDARLYRKGPGQPAKLAYLGHVLMENRHALVVDARLTLATGTAEREAGLEMIAARPGNHRITLGADKSLPSRKRGPMMWPRLSPTCGSTT